MTLKAHVESLDGIPESLREHYRQVENIEGYVLTVEPWEGQTSDGKKTRMAFEDVHGLRVALERQREAAKKLEAFSGIDPDLARKAIKYFDDQGNLDLDGEAKAQMEAVVEKKTAKFRERIAELEGQVEQHKTDADKVRAEFHGERAKSDLMSAIRKDHPENKAELIARLISDRVAYRDGRTVVVDENGEPEISGKPGSGGDPKGVDELIESLRGDDQFQPLFASKAKGGGGSGPSGAGGPEGSGDSKDNPFVKESENFSVTKQFEVIEKDPDRAKELAAAAGVKPYW